MLDREYRATPHLISLQTRDDDSDDLTFTGYASMFDSPYEVNDFLGSYTEVIGEGAFSKTLAESDDVRLLVNHDGIPLARTKSGTLRLSQDERGLWCEADLDGSSSLVGDVRSAMTRGDLDQMSFAFRVTRQEWDADYSHRTIREVQLFDVSVVTYPANPATTASMRSAVAARGIDWAQVARHVSDAVSDADSRTVLERMFDAAGVALPAPTPPPAHHRDDLLRALAAHVAAH